MNKHLKKLYNYFIITSVFLTVNCATIMTGGVQSIPIITDPSAATVSIYNSDNILLFEGPTPCDITMEKKRLINSRLVISKEGYKNIEIKIGKKIDNCFWGNICIGVIPGIVDIINGNWMTTDVGGVLVKLEEVRIVNNINKKNHFILSNNAGNHQQYLFDIERKDDAVTINIEEI